MLIWINGAFGAGKTHTAFELHRRLPNSHVADPELLGFAIHRMLPAAARDDFQDRPQWRSAVVATLADAVAAQNGGPVLVPMTVVDEDYFDELVDGLTAAGVHVAHFALQASPDTLEKRLRTRSAYWIGAAMGRPETWGIRQIPRCVAALATPRFATHVPTDGRTVDEVVEDVAARAGLRLVHPRLSPARYQLRRLAVAARHVRF